MTPRHHPPEEFLLAHVSGALPEGMSLVIATHMALCAQCRLDARIAHAIGGHMLEHAPPAALRPQTREQVLARIRQNVPTPPADECAVKNAPVAPLPLRDYLKGDIDAVRWRGLPGQPQYMRIATRDAHPDMRVRLLKAPPDVPIPEHDHGGAELTLVLSGSFMDGDMLFERGDCAFQTPGDSHSPMAKGGECICLLARDGPLHFKSPAMRLFQALMDI